MSMSAMTNVTPIYFRQEGFDAFKSMQLEETDVVMGSFGKCGTSWLHQIVFR